MLCFFEFTSRQAEELGLNAEERFKRPKSEMWKAYQLYVASQDGSERADPNSSITVAISPSLKGKYQKWENHEFRWDDFRAVMMNQASWPAVKNKEDASPFTPGPLIGSERSAKAMAGIDVLVSDHDDGQTMSESAELSTQQNAETIIAPSMNFGSRVTHIKHDDYIAWAKKNDHPQSITQDSARAFLEQTGQLLPQFACLSEYDGSPPVQHPKHGFRYEIATPPREKHRCVRLLKTPFRVNNYIDGHTSHTKIIKAVRVALEKALNSIGGTHDKATNDLGDCFFLPATLTSNSDLPDPIYVKGAAFELLPFIEAALAEPVAGKNKGEVPPSEPNEKETKPKQIYYEGKNLKLWAATYIDSFDFESLFRDRDLVKSDRQAGGVFVHCFHGLHSGGDPQTYVVNGDGAKGPIIHCSGASGGCTELKDRLLRLVEYLNAGLLKWEDFENPAYGGGQISVRARNHRRESKAKSYAKDKNAFDVEGRGLDVSVFLAALRHRPGCFDFDMLNDICGTQIASDVTVEQLADFINHGRVKVSELERCYEHASDPTGDDPYLLSLYILAKRKAEGLSGREVDIELEKIGKEFDVKAKPRQEDFKKAEKALASREETMPGVLSDIEVKQNKLSRAYAEKFCIINFGGKSQVMNMHEPQISKALSSPTDFVNLHKDDWYEIDTPFGLKTVHPARSFLDQPPPETLFYRGGPVFKPKGTVSVEQYNLYQGMQTEPDASGSCSMLHELLEDVWCGGDKDTSLWVKEWLMHIIAYPGEKVRSSIAIRGEQGDGKSIVSERLLPTILGELQLRAANHNMVLGNFNEALMGKLLVVLEEAAFAVDKAAFDKMKELISGRTVLINPKNKAPVELENFARLILLSNHDHFVHMKPGDRRYTVLESVPVWKGTNKFEQLVEQWDNGGASRFHYEALNHNFRRFDDRRTVIIDTSLQTKSAVRQVAQSRTPLEKAIVQFILRGSLSSIRGTVSCFEGRQWELDGGFEIQSAKLEDGFLSWLIDYDSKAPQHEGTLHYMIKKLEAYIGKTRVTRPKSSAENGSRKQLASVRHLPCRREALEHALNKGLITVEEFETAVPA